MPCAARVGKRLSGRGAEDQRELPCGRAQIKELVRGSPWLLDHVLLSLLVWGPLSRRRNHSGGSGSGTPPLARQRSVYQDQPPARRLSP